eukprot:6457428-Karenia_brevis.AAC.1
MPDEDDVFHRAAVCGLFGLTARRAGARRVKCSRASPGIGVNRRSHCLQLRVASRRPRLGQDQPGADNLIS